MCTCRQGIKVSCHSWGRRRRLEACRQCNYEGERVRALFVDDRLVFVFHIEHVLVGLTAAYASMYHAASAGSIRTKAWFLGLPVLL